MMNSAQFKSVVEPILNKVFDGVYTELPKEWDGVFRTDTGIKRRFHEEAVLFGFGAAQEIPEGDPMVYDEGGENYVARYTYKVYGLAFAITEILAEDGDHISVGTKYSRHLAISMNQAEEIVGAQILNRATSASYTGGDGVALASASHPLPAGGTYSNLETAANLSEAAIEQALIDISLAVDDRNKPIQLEGEKLVIHPSNVFNAERILKSVLRPGTPDNDLNAIRATGMLPKGWQKVTRLTNTKQWHILTNAPEGLKYLPRRSLKREMLGDFETGNMRYKATKRFAFGWTDPRGAWTNVGV